MGDPIVSLPHCAVPTALTTIAGLLAPATVLVATAAAPSAATHDCVSRNEFRRAHSPWTLLRTEAVFDTHGRLVYQGDGFKEKRYRACYGPDTGRVTIVYRHHHDAWRVEWKFYNADPDDCMDC